MRHLPLYTIVFVSGAVVLAIEIVGTRVLGPFYGVNLFLWSALITVTLAALSLGYAVGGRWADRRPRYAVLGTTLAVAGAWLLATIWLKRPVMLAVEPLGLRGAVLVSSFLLFFVPLTARHDEPVRDPPAGGIAGRSRAHLRRHLRHLDDRNPVDLWADAINWKARQFMHKNDAWKHLEY